MTGQDLRASLGWSPFFDSQLTDLERCSAEPARVVAVHRDAVEVSMGGEAVRVPQLRTEDPQARATVGDWVLLETGRIARVLARSSVFRRKAAGAAQSVQLIAANVDTLLAVTSCNADFNTARLERYLVLAREAGAAAAVVLTKADLCADPRPFVAEAARVARGAPVLALDGRDPAAAWDALGPWCGPGQTVAFAGMSGVGKSTLVNALMGADAQETQAIRDDDARGRHTTTGRSLHRLPQGGLLLDTPGMRELQLAFVADGLAAQFDDVVEIAAACRFADCGHAGEPGCAVAAAIGSGALDPARLKRYRKLLAEEAHNSASLRDQRAAARAFNKMARGALVRKRMMRGEEE